MQQPADSADKLLELIRKDDGARLATGTRGLQLGQAMQGSGDVHFVEHVHMLINAVQNLAWAKAANEFPDCLRKACLTTLAKQSPSSMHLPNI